MPVDDCWDIDSDICGGDPDDHGKPISLGCSLPVPGLLHIVHNATNDIMRSVQEFDDLISEVAEIATLLRHNYTCERLRESCFSCMVGKTFHHELKAFKGKVHRGRWGTMAFATQDILDLQSGLRRFWSLEKYEALAADGNAPGAGQHRAQEGVKLQVADAAITSPLFWGRLATLDEVFELIRKLFIWCEGCVCHTHVLSGETRSSIKSRWENCSMRSRRLPELAAGDFWPLLSDLCNKRVATLLLKLPRDLDHGPRSQCFALFERARCQLVFIFQLKLRAFEVPPISICAVAHHKPQVARKAVGECLRSRCTHPRFLTLRSAPVVAEAHEFVSGEDLVVLPHLRRFMAELRFGYNAERLAEGGHALVQRATHAARNRTEAFDSLALRLPEVKLSILNDQTTFTALLDAIVRVRTPAAAIRQLGLDQHPMYACVSNAWDPLHRKIIYRSDTHSMFHSRPPVQLVAPSFDPGNGDSACQADGEKPDCITWSVERGPSSSAGAEELTSARKKEELTPPPPADSIVCASGYDAILREATLQFFDHQIAAAGLGQYVYAIKAPDDSCFNTLMSLLVSAQEGPSPNAQQVESRAAVHEVLSDVRIRATGNAQHKQTDGLGGGR